jgi:hypothetical protein
VQHRLTSVCCSNARELGRTSCELSRRTARRRSPARAFSAAHHTSSRFSPPASVRRSCSAGRRLGCTHRPSIQQRRRRTQMDPTSRLTLLLWHKEYQRRREAHPTPTRRARVASAPDTRSRARRDCAPSRACSSPTATSCWRASAPRSTSRWRALCRRARKACLCSRRRPSCLLRRQASRPRQQR